MNDDDLARAVVRPLAQYLMRKQQSGSAVFDANLEGLLGQLGVLLSEPYLAETLERFKSSPEDDVQVETLRMQLARLLADQPDAARGLYAQLKGMSSLGAPKSRRIGRGVLIGGGAMVVVLVLVAWFALPRTGPPVSSADSSSTTATTTTTTTTVSTPSRVPSSVPSSSSASLPVPSSSFPANAQPGDGASLEAGSRMLVVNLPRPNDDSEFNRGDHDVQFTQYTGSLWAGLASCNLSRHSTKQQFRLKNFTRLEVPAVGVDSTSDPGLSVKFQVFVNTEQVKPIQEVVVGPGEVKPIAVDLPSGVFAVTFQASLTTLDKRTCSKGNAVWGSPYVVAGRN